MSNNIKIKLSEGAVVPVRGSAGAAGYDLSVPTNAKKLVLEVGKRILIKTGVFMKISSHLYGRVAPRSGLAYKKGIDVMAGVIDSDYRDEIGVILINLGQEPFEINPGDRIAQIIFERIDTPDLQLVDSLDETVRGTGGFGSTGV